ncbi:GNAT family N-acetyltransferase [Streptomyces sp. SID12501]|uniref:GNAT family N-acetyltransferase n=1 Tax=Streptomyces sp. SID12501 TaxID=2706042 RepID=A0A6B3BTN5_9ACTN|nr:GNAT family protein [Streptomyces sp. SID12501]NEC87725.1 GNAT family N-acetyltransferase [Streptomyces sp. SID12501]
MTAEPSATQAGQHGHWPLFGLVVRTRRLELRVPTDTDYEAVCDVAADGIHDPGTTPFAVDWTDAPPHLLRRNAFQFLWGTRASWSKDAWHLEFAVYHQGRPIGMKGLWATDFGALGEFSTGSWLGREFQGQGFGKEMRAAVLHFAFAGLGARWATSQVFEDNPASIAVNRYHGYQEDGFELRLRRDSPVRWLRHRLAADTWLNGPRDGGIGIEGLDTCREMFAPSPRPAPAPAPA